MLSGLLVYRYSGRAPHQRHLEPKIVLKGKILKLNYFPKNIYRKNFLRKVFSMARNFSWELSRRRAQRILRKNSCKQAINKRFEFNH
jgi:hypothetical protein